MSYSTSDFDESLKGQRTDRALCAVSDAGESALRGRDHRRDHLSLRQVKGEGHA